jgi:hypothetical protein
MSSIDESLHDEDAWMSILAVVNAEVTSLKKNSSKSQSILLARCSQSIRKRTKSSQNYHVKILLFFFLLLNKCLLFNRFALTRLLFFCLIKIITSLNHYEYLPYVGEKENIWCDFYCARFNTRVREKLFKMYGSVKHTNWICCK